MISKKIEAAGISLAYSEVGRGLPLVCLHGNFASKRWFTEQLAKPPPGFRLIALDLPNFGASDPMPKAVSIGAYARYLGYFLEALNLADVVLLGHSLGGAVAQVFASRQKERLAGLCLLASAGPRGMTLPADHYLDVLSTNPHLLTQTLALTMPSRTPSYFGALVEDALAMNQAAFTENARALQRYDVTQHLNLQCPVLVIRGQLDYLISEEMARETAQLHSKAELQLWQGVGHSPQIEAPKRLFKALTKFLSKL